jgi:thimet oligopeptidase
LRGKLFLAAQQVGYPANTETLRGLLARREELAEYLGKIDAASREPGAREDAALLAFARQREPSMQKISAADARYWQEQYRRAKFSFDSQSVRPYFPYAEVERGVIATAATLFHVDIKPVTGVHTWHSSVTTYDVFDGKVRLGRIYLDMHPREGKDTWFST